MHLYELTPDRLLRAELSSGTACAEYGILIAEKIIGTTGQLSSFLFAPTS